MNSIVATEAREAYDAFAPTYDDFNHRYMYERWTGRLLELARDAGLEGERLLDVGCGTGLSFVAMLDRGFEVTGCDISAGMLAAAREKAGERARLVEADMRELPTLGAFDLVWAVNDAINYLGSSEDLVATLVGMKRNLAPGGVILFDVNTILAYRTFFSEEVVVERGGRRYVWQGQGSADDPAGSTFEARFDGEGDDVNAHVHRQRHFPQAEVLAAIEAAGLDTCSVTGEREGELTPGVDEGVHTKAVFVCR
jgi:SAM-dependent methyltransferase